MKSLNIELGQNGKNGIKIKRIIKWLMLTIKIGLI